MRILRQSAMLVLLSALAVSPCCGQDEQAVAHPPIPDVPVLDEIFFHEPARSSDEPAFKLRGRIDTDFLWAAQDAENRAVYGDLPDRVGLRRARIGAEGKPSEHTHYVAEIDLATGEVVLRDVYFGWGDITNEGEWKVGHMREPFSLEGGTSANSFAFMERSTINTLDPARNWGVSHARCTPAEDATFAIGLFQAGTDASDLEFFNGSTTALTARGTYLVWYEDEGTRLMHVGAAISERIADRGVITLRQRPNSPLLVFSDSSESPFVPRLRFPANFQQLLNLQWAVVHGPFWAQAEWYGTLIPQRNAGDVFFHGCYLDVGYFLTGEHRKYLTQTGVFGPVSVKRPVCAALSSKSHEEELGFGAWEATVRFAYLDFSDADTPGAMPGEPEGVTLPQVTVGMNWYLADRMRLMFNYTYSGPDEVNTGASSASVFGMRLGVFW